MSAEFVSFIGDSFNRSDDALKILLRIRPPFSSEKNDLENFNIISNTQLNVKIPTNSWTYKTIKRHNINSSFNFEFSNIFDWNTSQSKLFNSLIDGLIFDFLGGKNGLLFTYGITNSGKTFTLIGKPDDPGILPRTINYIFKCLNNLVGNQTAFKKCPYKGVVELSSDEIDKNNEEKRILIENIKSKLAGDQRHHSHPSYDLFNFKINDDIDQLNLGIDIMEIPSKTTHYLYFSIYEIYNEQIYDLLDFNSHETLKVQGDQKNGFYVKNLKSILINSIEDAFFVLETGLSNRRMAETRLNINSSRSHVVYTISLIRCTELPNGVIASKSNEICFVDLAGAERQNRTLSEGDRLREASNINKSLLFLNRCIQEMRESRINRHHVVSYRESKLTQLLQTYFVGRARTVLLINISPSLKVFDDTFSVLKFSSLTKEALDRPMGIELHQAIQVDAVLTDPFINLETYSKTELVDIIHCLKCKLVDTSRTMESYDSLLREEMCQFTMDMITEIEDENENKMVTQRQLITESYLVKIDILNEEIQTLHKTIQEMNQRTVSKEKYEAVSRQVEQKNNDIQNLLNDVEIYKNDSKKEIKDLQNQIQHLKDQFSQKDKQNVDINKNIINLNKIIDNNTIEIKRLKDIEQKYQSLSTKMDTLNSAHNKSKAEIEKLNLISNKYNLLLKRISRLKMKTGELINETVSMKKTFSDEIKFLKNHASLCFNKSRGYRQEALKLCNIVAEKQNIIKTFSQKENNAKKVLDKNRSKIVDLNNRCHNILIKNEEKWNFCEDKIRGVFKKINLLKLKKNNETSKNIEHLKKTAALNQELTEIKKKFESYIEKNNVLEISNKNYMKEIEVLNSRIFEINRKFEDSGGKSLKSAEAKIMDLELQLKSYKELNEDYRLNVKKLQDVITERNIMAPLTNLPIIEPVKRPASPATKENYHGIFSKQTRKF